MTKTVLAGRILTGLAALPFIPSAAMKFMQSPEAMKGMVHLGIPESLLLPLAILETGCVLVYLIPKTCVLGAILLTGYLGGAILTHLRVDEPVYIPIAIGIVVWLGLYLRDARLREIFPHF